MRFLGYLGQLAIWKNDEESAFETRGLKYDEIRSETASRRPNLLMSPLTCKDVKVGDANALVGFGAGTVKAVCAAICRLIGLHLLCLPFDRHASGREM